MLEFDATLPSGHQVAVRPLAAGDEGTVQAVFDAMSPEARYHRFLQAMPRLSSRMRTILAAVDGDRHRAAVAWSGDRQVGIVRLVTDRDGDVELSVSVVDDFAGRGLGSLLTEEAAKAAGSELVILVHPENHRAMRLFRRQGYGFSFDGSAFVGRSTNVAAEMAA